MITNNRRNSYPTNLRCGTCVHFQNPAMGPSLCTKYKEWTGAKDKPFYVTKDATCHEEKKEEKIK